MREKELTYRLCAYKETILIAVLCGAALMRAPGGALLGGLAARLMACAPLTITLALPVCAGLRFTPVLGAVGILLADYMVTLLPFGGPWALALGLALAAVIAYLSGWLAGLLEAMIDAEGRGITLLSSLVTGCFFLSFFLGTAMLPPRGGVDFMALKAAFFDMQALTLIRALFAAVVAACVALMLICAARKAQVPYPALSIALLIAGSGIALTFLPGPERALMESSYSLYALVLLACGAVAPFELMKRLIMRHVFKRAYSIKRGLLACALAAAVFLYCCLPDHADMLEGIRLPAAPLLFAGCILALAAAMPHTGGQTRRAPCARANKAYAGKRARTGALIALAAMPAYLLMAINTGALPEAPQIAGDTLYAMAALLCGGAGEGRSPAGRAALGALLFFTLQTAAPLASAALYANTGIGAGFVHLLALGMLTGASIQKSDLRSLV